VLLDAGGRCQAVIDGVRCNIWGAELEAHHVVGLRQGGANDPANGVALCRPHHRLAESKATREASSSRRTPP
jgi:predicted restriction endonuclease